MLAFRKCPVGRYRVEVIRRVNFVWKTGDFVDFGKVGPVE